MFKWTYVLLGFGLLFLPVEEGTAEGLQADFQTEYFFNDPVPFEATPGILEPLQPPYYVAKRAGHYAPADWATAIDTTWGAGITDSLKAEYFRQYWDYRVGQWYPCFSGLSTDPWDSIYNLYWPDPPVSFDYSTVSKGRYAAILQQSSQTLLEAHQKLYDIDVANTAMLPGVPLMHIGQHYVNNHFGAGVTALLDSTALVYSVAPGHPLGLEPGDQIVGYDGISWTDLLQELQVAELPVNGRCEWGSSERSKAHRYIMSAGMNWHLFDTIDIRKYSTGDTEHFATDLLVGQSLQILCSEQIANYGVMRPTYVFGSPELTEYVSFGVIDGTDIGYIYCQGWFGDSATVVNEWKAIIDTLETVESVSGIIIDLRLNRGANINFWEIVERFFADTLDTFRFDKRCSATDHLNLCPSGDPFFIQLAAGIHGNSSTAFDRPVAILTGPNAESGGDLFPLMMSFRPRTKLFGLPTCGAFSGLYNYPEWKPGFSLGWTVVNLKYLGTPERHMSHAVFPGPDFPWADYEEVWLTPEGVAQGKDDVVEAAIQWLNRAADSDLDGIADSSDNCPMAANADQVDNDGDGVGNACCCVGLTGDVNADGSENLTDLTLLVNYLFVTYDDIGCPMEANTSGDQAGEVTLTDLTLLVNALFITFEPVAPCQ